MATLWITEHYFPNQGGMAQSCERIVSGLRGRGICIDVFHLAKQCRRRTFGDHEKGYDRCWPLEENPSHKLNLLWNYLELQPQRKYSRVVAYGTHFALISAQNFASYFDIPLFSFVRGNDFDSAVFDSRRRLMIESLYRDSAMVFCVSQDKQKKIARLFKGVQTKWIANGIDLSQWQVRDSHIEQVHNIQRLFPDQKKVIGLFGHIKDKKGALLLLNTIKIANLSEEFHLLIVGDLDEQTHSLLNCPSNKISYNLLPFCERNLLIPYYLSCDIVAIPSFYDGMPNVMLEASALGKTILCSTVDGMKDVLTQGETAIMFPPGDKDELRDMLLFIANADKCALQEIGLNAQQLIKQKYQAKMETDAYFSYFSKIQ